jgi:hypothetical protein
MDTIWFAVDQDGHVAGFRPNGAGAAPAARPPLTGEDQEQLCQRLQEILPGCPVRYELAGRITPGPLHQGTDHWAENIAQPVGVLMFLRSLDLAQPEITGGAAVQLLATEGRAVIFRSLLPELARRIHQSGECLACFYHSDLSEYLDMAGRGLFSYEQLLGDWLPGPYGRQRSPSSPVHIDQVPPDLRHTIGRVRFEGICFAQTVHLQPAEHMPCTAMNAGYVTADGRGVRPLPGQESHYREFYEEFLAEAPPGAAERLQIERPRRAPRKRR